MIWIPERMSMRSNWGHETRNSWYSCSVQNPITRSTPARLYQLLSNSTISPAAGRWVTYLWKYHWDCSRSVGTPRATTRQTRGLRRSTMRLMTPPFPAASRPSQMTSTLSPLVTIHRWRTANSSCSLLNSRS